jgi:hypothetical protein
MARPRPVGPPHLYSSAREWSAGPTLYGSALSARLAGHYDTTWPHVLQASMVHTSALEPCERPLEPRERALGIHRHTFLYACILWPAENRWTHGDAGALSLREAESGAI